ncbi:hypothetical protein CLOSTASPAR_03081 [[Clostridium] asparagiforme DSM 15981]|uniref:Uncharacterized protein n=1 Tax=[Clostridium] asparagiforme DSM 15981 TaxID=518636 RepID=C0D1E4_9FIRM|nr:hypothetical protein CLOSTASPAR_03081 [[Clostridium] asparagiforme DSM 15981]
MLYTRHVVAAVADGELCLDCFHCRLLLLSVVILIIEYFLRHVNNILYIFSYHVRFN